VAVGKCGVFQIWNVWNTVGFDNGRESGLEGKCVALGKEKGVEKWSTVCIYIGDFWSVPDA